METEGQLRYLRFHDCDEMQGYYFSWPVPAADLEAMLDGGRHLKFAAEKQSHMEKTVLLVDDEVEVAAALQRLGQSEYGLP